MNKKMKMIAFVVFFGILIVLGYVIYSNATKDDGDELNDKILTEMDYLEVKMIDMANRINNVTLQNYKVVTKEIESQTETENGSSSNNGGQEEQNQSGGGSSNTSSGDSSSSKDYEEYNMERIKELSKDKDEAINWGDIQKEIEEIYTVIPTITLDLYQTNINQEDILKMNGYLDDLAGVAKNEQEEETLNKICDMYSCISKFVENVSNDELNKISIKTKENVLRAYSKIKTQNWQEIVNNIQSAIDTFSVLLTNTNVDYGKQVNINKTYVILNEIKNAALKEDKEVFLIKYKNLLEEMNSM